MNNKIDIDLKGVPQTLLLPLVGRAMFSQKTYSPIQDKKAVELVNVLNYDFENYLKIKNVKLYALFGMARAYQFDEKIKTYIKKHPDAVIVNLGSGLDTGFNRIDNGQLTWVDIDLPDVINLRERLLPPSKREIYIRNSVFNYSWMDEVKRLGTNVFFTAGGLFMYFTQDQVKSLFINMANTFPNSNLIFDNTWPRALNHLHETLKKSGMEEALLQWGIYDGRVLEEWSPKIKFVEQHGYFKGISKNYPFPLSSKLIMWIIDLLHRSGIIHLKFI